MAHANPSSEPHFLVVGEALIDLVPDGDGTTFASPWQAQTAGGPLNTAVALARLGRSVDFAGSLSQDAYGHQMTAHLHANGVGTERLPASAGPTALAVLSLSASGSASYHFHTAGTATFAVSSETMPRRDPAEWLHVGSLALVVEPAAGELLAWVREMPGPLSVDLNVRVVAEPDPVAYWERVAPWVALVGERGGVVKGSDEDFAFLAVGADVSSGDELARRLIVEFEVGCVVITRGADGAQALLGDGVEVTVPGIRCEVVDTVAAGDTFMAGFLDAWTRLPAPEQGTGSAAEVTAAVRRGVAAAAVVVTRRGAQPPTDTEVETVLAGG